MRIGLGVAKGNKNKTYLGSRPLFFFFFSKESLK